MGFPLWRAASPLHDKVLLLSLLLLASPAAASMGPLQPDTTVLAGCQPIEPGDRHADCADGGLAADAPACAAACDADPRCSAVTWHDANQGVWASHCVQRRDNVTVFTPCGAGCGHTSAGKTGGWVPPPPPPKLVWPPLAAGCMYPKPNPAHRPNHPPTHPRS